MTRIGTALAVLLAAGVIAGACASEAPARGSAGAAAQGPEVGGGGASGSAGSGGAGPAGGGAGAAGGAGGGARSGGAGNGGASAAGSVASGTGGAGGAGSAASGTGGAAGAAGGDCPNAGALAAGMKTETLEVNGEPRSYLVVVPPSLDARMRAPVLLGFHGGSGTAENAYQTYGLAGDEAALYVYPQAISWPEAGGVAWNVDPAGHDLPYFDALLADLGEKYCIDAARVFAAGQSNGGFFVNALGCYRPAALRAIASAAGGGPPGQCSASVSAMIIHGSADMTVPIDQGRYSRDYWLAANDCADAPATPAATAPCVAYSGCAEPVLWCEHDGGHPWPDFAGATIREFFLSL